MFLFEASGSQDSKPIKSFSKEVWIHLVSLTRLPSFMSFIASFIFLVEAMACDDFLGLHEFSQSRFHLGFHGREM